MLNDFDPGLNLSGLEVVLHRLTAIFRTTWPPEREKPHASLCIIWGPSHQTFFHPFPLSPRLCPKTTQEDGIKQQRYSRGYGDCSSSWRNPSLRKSGTQSRHECHTQVDCPGNLRRWRSFCQWSACCRSHASGPAQGCSHSAASIGHRCGDHALGFTCSHA